MRGGRLTAGFGGGDALEATGAAGAGLTGTEEAAVALLLETGPLEKKLARAATTPTDLFVSFFGTSPLITGAGLRLGASAESALSKLSKLESAFSVRGERVTPGYWPARFWAIELGGARETDAVVTEGVDPLPIIPSLFGRIGIGREISILTVLFRVVGSSAGSRLLDILFVHQLTGQNNRPRY